MTAPQGSTQKDKKAIDYILVIEEENLPLIKEYIANLQVLGFETENVIGQTVDFIFIKVFITEEALRHFSEIYDIGNQEIRELTELYLEPIFPNPFATPISRVIPKNKGEITDAERIMIVHKILENTRYGEDRKEFGLSKLIKINILKDAYPLHDGPISLQGTNIRSLLFYNWSNTNVLHKQQPLDLIYRYFGTEIAFYFAWLEYFNIMLILPAILGALTFIGSAAYIFLIGSSQIDEVCKNSNSYVCPTCEGEEGCRFKRISEYCSLAHYSLLFDNEATVAFAIFMSFWAMMFLNLWRLKENKLKMRWHTNLENMETDIRQYYIEHARRHHRNIVSGEEEPYTPWFELVCRYFLTTGMWALSIAIIFVSLSLSLKLKEATKVWMNTSNNDFLVSNSRTLSMIEGSLTTLVAIIILQQLYTPFSIKLTEFENPKTQTHFDKSVLYKRYMLSFANNYVSLFHLAFFKGALYTVPHKNNTFTKNVCQPLNCILDLCIQLSFLMAFKHLMGNIFSMKTISHTSRFKKFWNYCTKPIRRIRRIEQRALRIEKQIPQWEEEYFLAPTGRYTYTAEFSEMVIRYGLVTFFVAAFPLAPLCALANNLLELRSDAYKVVKLYRRPIPLYKCGIGPWNGVLLSVTYLSTATNAFVLAFTSDWVPRQVFRFNNSAVFHIPGYFNSTMSYYDTKDYDKYSTLDNNVPYCFYRGYHYSADHQHEYKYTQEYWVNLTYRFVAIFIFETIKLHRE